MTFQKYLPDGGVFTLSPIMVQWKNGSYLKGNDPIGDTPIFQLSLHGTKGVTYNTKNPYPNGFPQVFLVVSLPRQNGGFKL